MEKPRVLGHAVTLFFTAALLLTACSSTGEPVAGGAGGRLQVVATTTLVGNVTGIVGGEAIDLTVLLPEGTDPHAYEPTPQDVIAVANADLVFVNGAGLEVFLEALLENAGGNARIVSVSEGLELLPAGGEHEHEEEHEAEDEHEEEHEHSDVDPHVWFDPHNVIVWTTHVEQALSDADPDNAALYAANAEQYRATLRELDVWIRAQVATVPQENRRLVSDHRSFSYFARRYGFEQVGAVFPSISTLSEPSAQELAELEDRIRALDVQAVFVGWTANPALAERVANDTGTQLVFLYTGSLSEADGPADSYVNFMRYNVDAIVRALE